MLSKKGNMGGERVNTHLPNWDMSKLGNERAKTLTGVLPNPDMEPNGQPVADIKRASRNWCFTLFDYLWEDIEFLADLPAERDLLVRGVIFQEEVAPTTGRRHLQGFLRFKKGLTLDHVRNLLHPRTPHLEMAIHPSAAVEYCRKGDTRDGACYEEGDLTFEQGKSNELRELTENIVNGADLRSIVEQNAYQYVLHSRGIEALRGRVLQQRVPTWRQVSVYVLYGPPGSSKTRSCYQYDRDLFKVDRASSGGVWFDGYDGQRTLLLDDFYGWIPYSQLLNLLDGYQLRLDVKGGHTYAAWDTVIISSNDEPDTWYNRLFPNGCAPALARRIRSLLDTGRLARRLRLSEPAALADYIVAFLRGDNTYGRTVTGAEPGGAVSGAYRERSDPDAFPGRAPAK